MNTSTITTEITISGRTYEILSFLRGNEKLVVGHTVVERAQEMNANLGQDDGEHILKHQDEIPVALRDKISFVFSDWRRPDLHGNAYLVTWSGVKWVRGSLFFDFEDWGGNARLLRRK